MDPATLVSSLQEIKRLSRDPLAVDRIAFIVDRLTGELRKEMQSAERDEESGRGAGLVQPPKDN